jgi:hypothetical protein
MLGHPAAMKDEVAEKFCLIQAADGTLVPPDGANRPPWDSR